MRAPSPLDRGIDDPDPVALPEAVFVVFPSSVVDEGGTREGGRRVMESLGAHTRAQSTNGSAGGRPGTDHNFQLTFCPVDRLAKLKNSYYEQTLKTYSVMVFPYPLLH